MDSPTAASTNLASPGPSSEMTRTLVGIWARILNIPPTSVFPESNFFELGGDAALAVGLAREISKVFGMPFTVSDVLQCKSLAEMSTYMDGSTTPPARSSSSSALRSSSSSSLRASRGRISPIFAPGKQQLPRVVCIPGAVPIGFSALRDALHNEADVTVLSFHSGPVSEVAATVADRMGSDEPIDVLVAFSTGAAFAHALANSLAERRLAPRVLLMLDSKVDHPDHITDAKAALSFFFHVIGTDSEARTRVVSRLTNGRCSCDAAAAVSDEVVEECAVALKKMPRAEWMRVIIDATGQSPDNTTAVEELFASYCVTQKALSGHHIDGDVSTDTRVVHLIAGRVDTPDMEGVCSRTAEAREWRVVTPRLEEEEVEAAGHWELPDHPRVAEVIRSLLV